MCLIALVVTSAQAQTKPIGSGPYPAIIEGDPGISGHTIYRPEDLSPFDQKNPLPIFAWGNGACMNSNTFYAPFLAEIASHGFLVVAIGPYNASGDQSMGGGQRGGMMGGGMGGTKSAQLLEALDWATAENASAENGSAKRRNDERRSSETRRNDYGIAYNRKRSPPKITLACCLYR